MFIAWKSGHTTFDIVNLPEDLATILIAMDNEFTITRTPEHNAEESKDA
jgi:hypothetical protein